MSAIMISVRTTIKEVLVIAQFRIDVIDEA